MDQQALKEIRTLLANGRALMSENDVMDAHRDFEGWADDVAEWLESWAGLGVSAEWGSLAHSLLVTAAGYNDSGNAWMAFRQAVQLRLAWLGRVLAKLDQASNVPATTPVPKTKSRRIFVVHGHDEGARETVARFIGQLGFEPVILHEQANKGRTIITKFREEANDAAFAVVLMTPDDHGGKAGAPTRQRARQNVVFELGFFIGALGPEKVASLVKGDVEKPSDFDGVVYISLDGGSWKIELAKEFKAAGLEIDSNKVMGV